MRAEGKGEILRLEEVGGREARFHVGRQVFGEVRGERHVLQRDVFAIGLRFGQRAGRVLPGGQHGRRHFAGVTRGGRGRFLLRAVRGEASFVERDARGVCAEQVRGDLRSFLFEPLDGDEDGRAAHGRGATAERADAVLHD